MLSLNLNFQEPQWENTTDIFKGTFKKFLEKAQNPHEWLYFDYKYLKDWLSTVEELQSVTFQIFKPCWQISRITCLQLNLIERK